MKCTTYEAALTSKYSPQHPLNKHPHSVFFPYCVTYLELSRTFWSCLLFSSRLWRVLCADYIKLTHNGEGVSDHLSARFEVSMAMKIQVVVFWVVTPCSQNPESQNLHPSVCLSVCPRAS